IIHRNIVRKLKLDEQFLLIGLSSLHDLIYYYSRILLKQVINACELCNSHLIQTDAKIKAMDATLHLMAKHHWRVLEPFHFFNPLGYYNMNICTNALLLVASISSKAM
ncbi:hypothetical protein, partial [Olivibacter jilunii]|uniref:hypothetical protein n=1 Tax=Olivibacter jilunii TaxID=985016 RepID=UPI003F1808DD